MRLKTLTLSVLVLAALAAVAWYLRRPAPSLDTDARIGQPLVDRALVEKAARVRISDQGKTVQLARLPDGTWSVPSYYDLPADFSKLSAFVASLTDGKYQRLVTTNPGRIARLEFKDTTIALLDSSGGELWTLTLGKSPDSGGGRFVRHGSEPKAYLASFSAWLDVDAKNWANPELLNLKADSIARVEIPFAEGGTVVVSRAKKEDPWVSDQTPAGQRLKADRVTSLLGSIGSLRFSDTNELTDPAVAAANANLRTFKLTTFERKTVTIALGRKPEEKKLKPPPAPEAPKSGEPAKDAAKKPGDETKAADAKPTSPEFETIPAGPVFAFISDGDASAWINAAMKRRAFQVADYSFSALPQKAEELYETPPPAPTPAKADDKPAADLKPAEKKP